MRAPRTDEYSIGVDREVGRRLADGDRPTCARMAPTSSDGRTSAASIASETRPLPDGTHRAGVRCSSTPLAARRFLLTNPDGYSLTYNGLVRRRRQAPVQRLAGVWLVYVLEGVRAAGVQRDDRSGRAGQHRGAPESPPAFGRDPNDLTNARGRLPNDRPHMFRAMGSVDVPRTGLVVAANLQIFSGKPWAATAQVSLPQNGEQRVLLEPRGSRRLSSQSLLDVARVADDSAWAARARAELLLDVLNLLNDAAEESFVSENLFSANFGQPNAFVDPRPRDGRRPAERYAPVSRGFAFTWARSMSTTFEFSTRPVEDDVLCRQA